MAPRLCFEGRRNGVVVGVGCCGRGGMGSLCSGYVGSTS